MMNNENKVGIALYLRTKIEEQSYRILYGKQNVYKNSFIFVKYADSDEFLNLAFEK